MSRKLNKRGMLTLIVFFYVYTPPVFSFNLLHIMAILSYAILFAKFSRDFLSFIKNRHIAQLMMGVLCSITLLSTTLVFTTRNFIILYNIIIIILELLPITILIAILFKKYNYSMDEIVQVLLDVSLLQSLVAVLMFVSPEVKEFVISSFYDSYFSGMTTMSYWVRVRVFGFAAGMMFAMPIAQGFLASIAFAYSLKKSIKYFLYIPPLLFSALINARAGVLIFIVNVMVILILNIKRWKFYEVMRIAIIILIIIQILPFSLLIIESTSNVTSNWIKDGYYETMNFFLRGEKTGYYQAVSNMFFLPGFDTFLFGSGQDYFGVTYEEYSTDIGYVNDLFLGGIFFVLLLYLSIIFFHLMCINQKNWESKYLSIMMVTTMLLSNVKGYAFRQNEFLNLFILISVILQYYRHYAIKMARRPT